MELPPITLPTLFDFNFSFLREAPIFSIIFIIFLIFYVGASFILIYHWHAYGMKGAKVILAEIIYVVFSVFLISVASLALNYV